MVVRGDTILFRDGAGIVTNTRSVGRRIIIVSRHSNTLELHVCLVDVGDSFSFCKLTPITNADVFSIISKGKEIWKLS